MKLGAQKTKMNWWDLRMRCGFCSLYPDFVELHAYGDSPKTLDEKIRLAVPWLLAQASPRNRDSQSRILESQTLVDTLQMALVVIAKDGLILSFISSRQYVHLFITFEQVLHFSTCRNFIFLLHLCFYACPFVWWLLWVHTMFITVQVMCSCLRHPVNVVGGSWRTTWNFWGI